MRAPPRSNASMDRRRFLREGTLAGMTLIGGSGLGLLPGCAAHPRHAPTPMLRHDYVAPETSFLETACNLPPVRVSADREIRTVVGLRPFRHTGFRVEAESVGDTLVIHNYGHGGGGITLSWGTAKLAVDLAQDRAGPAAVIGCGAVGLATARLLQERGHAVTIHAQALPPDTTSNIAGGQWLPYLVADSDRRTATFDQQFDAAARYAHRRYQLLVGPRYGVR